MHLAPHSARAAAPMKDGVVLPLALALLLALPLAAAADDSGANYARSGWYLGAGGVGASFLSGEKELESRFGVSDADIDSGLGFNLRAGYRGHEHLGVEVAFELMNDVDFDLSDGDSDGLDTWTLMALTKPYLLTGRVQPFVLAGLGVMRVKVPDVASGGPSLSSTQFAVRFGGGADFYLTEHVVVELGMDYVLPTGDISDFDYLAFGLGLKYRF